MGLFSKIGKVIGGAITPITNLAGTYLKTKADEMKAASETKQIGLRADADVKVANANAANHLAQSGQTQTYDLDRIAMEQMDKTWDDNIMRYILLAPLVLAFAGFNEEVKAGFAAFKEMPDWYQYLVIGVYVVTFGMRGLLNKLLSMKPKLSLKS